MKRSDNVETGYLQRAGHVVAHNSTVTRAHHAALRGHRSVVVWLTGMPGSGKSTIADATQRNLHARGIQTALLDGDNIRLGLCSDLGFSEPERNENVRRVAETAKLFLEAGVVVIVALVSPVREARERIKQLFTPEDFIEVFCSCPSIVCQERDPKGHYSLAKRGDIANFTGVSAEYQEPLCPTLQLNTAEQSAQDCVESLTELILDKVVD